MFTDHMSEEILGEWDWSERYAAQPEILRYLEFVTDKMDLRQYIQFNARVVSAVYDPERNRWDIRLADGGAASARFLVTAVGCLSSTNTPKFPGIGTFAGESYHTGAWPHEGVDFTGQRVAVIGTGATAVQAVPEIAKQAAHVWVFQRTPNYDIPGRNRPLEPAMRRKSRPTTRTCGRRPASPDSGYPIRSWSGPRWTTRPRSGSPSSRRPGPRAGSTWAWRRSATTWSTRRATTRSPSSSAARSARSSRPAVAELLAPKDHPFFTKRPPLENGYYEASTGTT
jgi:cyclohexanone monooxygenase